MAERIAVLVDPAEVFPDPVDDHNKDAVTELAGNSDAQCEDVRVTRSIRGIATAALNEADPSKKTSCKRVSNIHKGPLSDGESDDASEESNDNIEETEHFKKRNAWKEINCDPLDDSTRDINEFKELRDVLPESFWDECHVCSYEVTNDGFICTFRLPYSKIDDAKSFIDQFSKMGKVAWRTERTKPSHMSAGNKNIFYHAYRCQRSSSRVSKHLKRSAHKIHTACLAKMTVTVKRVIKRCRSKDPHMPHYPMIVVLHHTHNHELKCGDALQLLDVSEEIEQKIISLFKNQHNPSSAYKLHLNDIYEQHGDKYFIAASDRSICPDKSWYYRLYYKLFSKECVPSENTSESLMLKIQELNMKFETEVVRMAESLDGKPVIVICTPLMRRVHALMPHSAEITSIDSTSGVNRFNNRVFMMLTPSCAGSLPLAVIITTTEIEGSLTAAFVLLKDMLGDSGFYNRGLRGPKLFATDDATSERNALSLCFPEAKLLTSVFHVLQAVWKWLLDSKNRIEIHHRPELFFLMKAIVFATSEESLVSSYYTAYHNTTAKTYPSFMKHLDDVWQTSKNWAVCLQKHHPVSENSTSNLAESMTCVIKDKLLHLLKDYSIVQLLDFVLTRFEPYYEKKLKAVALNRTICRSCFLPFEQKVIEQLEVKRLSEDVIEVRNAAKETTHHVNTVLETCSCRDGIDGSPCKHQFAVLEKHRSISLTCAPTEDPVMCKLLHQIATGHAHTDEDDVEMGTDWSSAAVSPALIKCAEEFKEFSQMILEKLYKFPEIFQEPLTQLVNNAKQLENNSALASACAAFASNDSLHDNCDRNTNQLTAVAQTETWR